MAFELRELSGFLTPNKYHQPGDNRPCLKGELLVNGQPMELSVWAPKEGKKAYSFRIKEPYQKGQGQQQQHAQPQQQQAQQSAPSPLPPRQEQSSQSLIK